MYLFSSRNKHTKNSVMIIEYVHVKFHYPALINWR